MVSVATVAQMAARFIDQSPDKAIRKMKLQKLLYLADRASMEKYGYPISDDRHYCMPHGPCLSETLNLMRGISTSDVWDLWIWGAATSDERELSLTQAGNLNRDSFDELSDADIEILDYVWETFGNFTDSEIRDVTHKLPEYTDPDGSSEFLPLREIFSAIGYDKESATDAQIEVHSLNALSAIGHSAIAL